MEEHTTELLGTSITPEEDDDGRRDANGNKDRKHAVTPSPAGTVRIDTGGNLSREETIDDVWRGDERLDDRSPLQRSNVGNEHSVHYQDSCSALCLRGRGRMMRRLTEVNARITQSVDDHSDADRGDVLRGRNDDNTEREEQDGERHGARSRPQVGHLQR